jgi:hypothetical protein
MNKKEKLLTMLNAIAWGLLVPGLVMGFILALAVFKTVLG